MKRAPTYARQVLRFNMRHGGANLTLDTAEKNKKMCFMLLWQGQPLGDWLTSEDFDIVFDAFERGFELGRAKRQ